ncbi:hypothetical protein OG496_02285 [Streptomyces sp. NBC_00988]|uniref:hypothetical protein n=1 Tax=Streptomyces sp. NBC_00988 TaxID=2903704 RepID=UPI0038683156|nr:hypothetical protein OG496_02285 [Streptomyces sp. NBC_00988]
MLNVGLDLRAVADPDDPAEDLLTVDSAQVQAGLDKAAAARATASSIFLWQAVGGRGW